MDFKYSLFQRPYIGCYSLTSIVALGSIGGTPVLCSAWAGLGLPTLSTAGQSNQLGLKPGFLHPNLRLAS